MNQTAHARRGMPPKPWRFMARAWLLLAMLVASALPAMANGDYTLQMFDNPSPVDRGADLTYQANVFRSSGGNEVSIGVGRTLTFSLPSNLTFVSVTSSASFSCAGPGVGTSGPVTCTVILPIYGTFEQVTLVTNTTSDAAPTRTMTATLQNTGDTNPGDNIATTVTPVTEPRTPTTTVTTSSAQPSTFGQAVTFTSTVTGAGATPTGLFSFFIDGNPGTPINLDGNGQATYTISTLSVGTHTVCGYYLGDSNNLPSCGALPGDQVVNPPATTTVVASSQNPSTPGQPVTFTATVSATTGTPGGTVTFKDGGTVLGTVTLSGGAANFTTAALSIGTHAITAEYGGDGTNFSASTSPPLSQTVAALATTTALVSSQNPSTPGQSVTFTATVTAATGAPTGSVTFRDGRTTLGTVALSGGTASFATTALAVGVHAITADYVSDSATFTASTSASVSQSVGALATATALTSSKNPSLAGESVTFTATVTAPSGTPTGSVTFRDGGTTLGTVALAGGTASFATTALSVGVHAITADYSGGGPTFSNSASTPLSQSVGALPTTTALASSRNPSNAGESVTFTATVSAATGTATGSVTFTIDGTDQAPVAVTGGAATFATAALAVGNHAVGARYGGDASYQGSTSATLTQGVRAVTGTIVIRQVTDAPDGAYAFTSPTAALNVSVTTVSGSGQSAAVAVASGTHLITAADTRDAGVALTGLACSDGDSTGDVATRTATVSLSPGESVTCTFTSTGSRQRTTGLIENFLATRADLILSNQTDTDSRIGRLNGAPAGSGDPVSALMGYAPGLAAGSPVTVSTSLNALSRMTGAGDPQSPFDIWFKGTYASLDSDAGGGTFGLATFGADYVFNRDLLLGAIVQIDRLSLDQPGSAISGTGWLAGPYVTARLAPNLYLDVVAAAGTSSNTVSPYGSYSDDFDTTRWMVQAIVKGDWAFDAWTFSPGARLGYFSEGADAYTDSLGVAIPDISAGLGQFAISPQIGYRFETESDMTIDTRLKLEGIVDFGRNGAQTGFGDTHGRVEAGVDFTMKGGMKLGFATAYDGIGSSDLSAIGGTMRISVPLN